MINQGSGISLGGATGSDTLTISLSNDLRHSGTASDTHVGNQHDFIYFNGVDTLGLRFYTGNVEEMRLEEDGDLHVDGDVVAYSSTTASDMALKENLNPITDALDKVLQLGGYSFDWKDKKRGSSTGLIAQDVEKILPNLVKDQKGLANHKTLNYNGIIGLLVESIKELKSELDDLKSSNS